MHRQVAMNLLNKRRESLQNCKRGHPLALDGDFCDRGRSSAEKSLLTGLHRGFDDELELVKRATKKVEQGKYGICEGCRQPIPDERLEAIPETPYCRACGNKINRGTRNGKMTYAQPVFGADFAGMPA